MITAEYLDKVFQEEMSKIEQEIGEKRFLNGKFDLALKLFKEMIFKEDFDEFLTLPAYQYI
jgi:malate synthase